MNAKNILLIIVGYVIGIVGVVGAVQLAVNRNLQELPPTPFTANTGLVRASLTAYQDSEYYLQPTIGGYELQGNLSTLQTVKPKNTHIRALIEQASQPTQKPEWLK